MPNFMFVYHGGKRPEGQDAIDKAMAAWGKWMKDNGPAFVDTGNSVGMSKTVSSSGTSDDGGSNPVFGYSIVSTPDMAEACRIASSIPMVTEGGSIEVAEILRM